VAPPPRKSGRGTRTSNEPPDAAAKKTEEAGGRLPIPKKRTRGRKGKVDKDPPDNVENTEENPSSSLQVLVRMKLLPTGLQKRCLGVDNY